jgi:hypothetical protein
MLLKIIKITTNVQAHIKIRHIRYGVTMFIQHF